MCKSLPYCSVILCWNRFLKYLGLYKSIEKENVEIERRGTKKDRRQMK